MLNRFHSPSLLLLFALAGPPACGREVTVRLYTNQPPERITLLRVGAPVMVNAASSPDLHVVGRWQAHIPGGETLALSYPLDVGSKGGRLALTVRMPLEEYVQAVLAGESIGFRSEQGLAAMAVAARTYAVRYLGRHKSEGYDFCDTTHCQDIHIQAVTERLRQAAEATEGELLWFEGAPAFTFYGKDCGGAIEAGAAVWPELKAPYLTRHEDPHCPENPLEIACSQGRSAGSAAGVGYPNGASSGSSDHRRAHRFGPRSASTRRVEWRCPHRRCALRPARTLGNGSRIPRGSVRRKRRRRPIRVRGDEGPETALDCARPEPTAWARTGAATGRF